MDNTLSISCFLSSLAFRDFTPGVLNVTFPAVPETNFTNYTVSCVDIPILEDTVAFEGVENFSVILLPPDVDEGLLVTRGENVSLSVTIRDNDSKFVCIHVDGPLVYMLGVGWKQNIFTLHR